MPNRRGSDDGVADGAGVDDSERAVGFMWGLEKATFARRAYHDGANAGP
jgi:hypothetical protein